MVSSHTEGCYNVYNKQAPLPTFLGWHCYCWFFVVHRFWEWVGVYLSEDSLPWGCYLFEPGQKWSSYPIIKLWLPELLQWLACTAEELFNVYFRSQAKAGISKIYVRHWMTCWLSLGKAERSIFQKLGLKRAMEIQSVGNICCTYALFAYFEGIGRPQMAANEKKQTQEKFGWPHHGMRISINNKL